MKISTSNEDDKAIIKVSGRFDFSRHSRFREVYEPLLQHAGLAALEVDISGIEYCNSTSLGMLLLLRERAQALDKTVALSKPSRKIARLLEVAQFNRLFAIS